MDNGQFEEIYSGPINKNKTIHEPEARGDNSVELFKTYTYRIEETQNEIFSAKKTIREMRKEIFITRKFCRLDFVDYFCTAKDGRGDSENPLPLNIFN